MVRIEAPGGSPQAPPSSLFIGKFATTGEDLGDEGDRPAITIETGQSYDIVIE